MTRILIVDDHPLIREGLKTLLHDEPDLKVVAEARNSHEVLQGIEQHDLDLIILDISLPGKSGLDVLRELKQRRSKTPVLVLTMHPEARYAQRAFKAGAVGYLTKDSVPAELVKAIRKVLANRRYISERFAEKLILDLEAKVEELPHEALSDREYQVFCMIASGKGTHEIAKELSLREATIYTYRERILEKMNMKSVVELARYALECGLIE